MKIKKKKKKNIMDSFIDNILVHLNKTIELSLCTKILHFSANDRTLDRSYLKELEDNKVNVT